MMRILTMTTPNMENGLGCRVTLWFAGCSHHCPGCHNKHTWDYNQGSRLLTDSIIKKIDDEVAKDYISGITLSGGDPLSQSDESLNDLNNYLDYFKSSFPNKNIWIYAGDLFEDAMQHPIKKQILSKCDVMVDGTFKRDLYDPDIAFRGSTNQRIIDIKASLKENKTIQLDIK